MIRGLTIIPFLGLEYTVIPDQDLSVLWSKIDLIVRHVSYFKFDSRAIKPHFHATLGFFFQESEYLLFMCRSFASHFRCSLIKTPRHLIFDFCSIFQIVILLFVFLLGEATIIELVFLKLIDSILAAQYVRTLPSSSLITLYN